MLTQSPSGVPFTHVWMWSIAADAADAADEAPRALMMAAPRCCTIGMNCSLYQASSTSVSAGRPLTVAWCRSGYCVAEWLPQMMILRRSVVWVPVFSASCDSARLWSRRTIAVKLRGLRLGAFFIAISELVLAG